MSEHKSRYKNTALDSKELRRRREEDTVQLRRQKRDDVWTKRRIVEPVEDVSISNLGGDNNDLDQSKADVSLNLEDGITPQVLDAIKQDVDMEAIVVNARKVRKILSQEPQPPFQEVLQCGIMPRLIELLDRYDQPDIQFEVAWILTNICSGTTEQTRAVVNHGAVPKLVKLCSSPIFKVYEQAVWALGNIIGDGSDLRDLVIAHDFIPALLSLLKPDLAIGFLRNLTWVIVNICRNKDPPPSITVIQQLIQPLIYLIQSTDMAILIDTTWAVSYITELGPDYSQLIIDSGLVRLMTPLLSHKEMKIQTAAIRAFGSIATGDNTQTQAIIDAGSLSHIHRLMKESKDKTVKEALWFLSNIAASSTTQIQAIVDNDLVPLIIYHLSEGEFQQQKEATWVVYNMCLSGSTKQIKVLIDENAVPALCNLLNIKDKSMIRNILESLSCILNVCHDDNPDIVLTIEECGGLDKIESLMEDENEEVSNFAYNIIEKFFPPEPGQQD